MRLSSPLPRATLILLLTYMVAIGATYNGILTPPFRLQALIALGIGLVLWLVGRWRKRGSHWDRTALDLAILVWVVAFTVSLVANADVWRRIVMGLWYMAVYIGVWYVLHDALANRLITRDMLVDALLFAGFIVILFGYTQMQGWLRDTLPQILAGEIPFSLPRPVSTLGNANTLAAVLVILVPLSVGRAVGALHRIPRVIMITYSIAALLLLAATYSRAGWIGCAAGLAILAIWLLADRKLLSPKRWHSWLTSQKLLVKLGIGAGSVLLLIVLIGGTAFFVRSFSVGGRTLDLRTFIYDTAFTMFAEKPITGYGLFTFGGGLARLNSTPPTEPHSHAHSIPLQIAAELGIVGLAALLLTLLVIYRGLQRNLGAHHTQSSALGEGSSTGAHGGALIHVPSAKVKAERLAIISAAAAFVSFGVHHLLDLPAMNPAVMTVALVTLVVAAAPLTPTPLPRSAGRGIMALAVGGFAFLLATGLWSSLVYSQYVDALYYGLRTGDYTGGAARLEPVVAADPSFAVYHQERGFLLGLAAASGNTSVLPDAIAEFERYTALAPEYAFGWANLGALYAQSGDYERAATAMLRAVQLAPEAPSLAERLSEYETAITTREFPQSDLPLSVPISTDPDNEFLANINYVQWLRLTIPRQFLPQVGYREER